VLQWGSGNPELRMPGGFTGTDFLTRFDASIARIEAQHADQTVVVFSHGAAMRLWVQVRCRNVEPQFTVYADLDNTGMAIMEGGIDPDGGAGFDLMDWRGAAAGLTDATADDVTGEPVAEAIADAD
jgi:broad specificity phosphatase PhoE